MVGSLPKVFGTRANLKFNFVELFRNIKGLGFPRGLGFETYCTQLDAASGFGFTGSTPRHVKLPSHWLLTQLRRQSGACPQPNSFTVACGGTFRKNTEGDEIEGFRARAHARLQKTGLLLNSPHPVDLPQVLRVEHIKIQQKQESRRLALPASSAVFSAVLVPGTLVA